MYRWSKMIYKIIFLLTIHLASCQYPRERAPPANRGPPPQAYEAYDDYPPQPRQQAPPAPRPNPRNSDLLLPASVHYVNIGAELAGDYKFGYDTGKRDDGQSFREETRLPDGSVQGAYGYVDETGTQRIVKYRAGKDGFHILKEGEPEGSAPAQQAPQQAQRQPQPAYRAPAPTQPAYRAPAPAQPAYRAPPAAQQAYRAPAEAKPAYRPPAQPAYRAPEAEQFVYGAQPAPRPAPRPQASRPRYAPQPKEAYDESQDYDYPNNDIAERRIVPIDTTLFNYNIGTSHGSRS